MKKYLVFYLIFHTLCVCAQIGIKIETPIVIDKAVEKLAGDGVEISGITYVCPPAAFGEFEDVLGEVGLDAGLVLTNGSASEIGTVNEENFSKSYGNDSFDSDLTNSLNQAGIFGVSLYDACKIEFDIVAATTELSFQYVFGSEEYVDFVDGGFSDVFGFYITGEFKENQGIETYNLATVPNSNEIVSIESINHKRNKEYYIDNEIFQNVPGDKKFEYDGYTVPLKATTKVIPCQKYHMKLIIADFGDDQLDSGVLIESGSFKSVAKPLAEVQYEHDRFDFLIEGCNNGDVIFKRPEYSDITEELLVNYNIKGSATNTDDYNTLSKTITIPSNTIEASYSLIPLADDIKEGQEDIVLEILNTCPQFPIAYTLTIPLREDFDYEIPDEAICFGDSIQLNKEAIDLDSLIWESHPNLSCITCNSPITKPLQTTSYQTTVYDKPSLCKVKKEVTVEVVKVEANFDYAQDENYTSLDILFANKSTNATVFNWSFGDGKTSTEKNNTHYYPFENTSHEPQKYIAQLISKSESPAVCSDTISKEILIEEPLFIPNVITPNNDLKNDNFLIDGIIYNKWAFTVYNRWGQEIYFTEGYNNEWTGESVSDGMYYYELKNPQGDRVYKGWIEILR